MNRLSKIYTVKIIGTVLVWCLPLLLLPANALESIGLPPQPTTLFLRLLGWAYVALCVGYAFGLWAALRGEVLKGPVWAGIASNGGACIYLLYFGISGAFSGWGFLLNFIAWSSAVFTAFITLGLLWYGVIRPEDRIVVSK